jgi:hypothetical protein
MVVTCLGETDGPGLRGGKGEGRTRGRLPQGTFKVCREVEPTRIVGWARDCGIHGRVQRDKIIWRVRRPNRSPQGMAPIRESRSRKIWRMSMRLPTIHNPKPTTRRLRPNADATRPNAQTFPARLSSIACAASKITGSVPCWTGAVVCDDPGKLRARYRSHAAGRLVPHTPLRLDRCLAGELRRPHYAISGRTRPGAPVHPGTLPELRTP